MITDHMIQIKENGAYMKEFPYAHEKVPVSHGITEFQTFLNQHNGYTFCPYLAFKDAEGWDKSTSRVYMNQVIPNFIYPPVNIEKGDEVSLREFFKVAKERRDIVAVNITQPHKSNPVLKELFQEDLNTPVNIDTLVKNQEGQLVPYDLNAPAFVDWYNEEVGTFTNKNVVMVGVGGVGEPIARRIITAQPTHLVLVDPVKKEQLVKQLSEQGKVSYYSNVGDAELGDVNDLVVINCAGKEGVTAGPQLQQLLQQLQGKGEIFVDLRPQLDVEIVQAANELGWKSYTGHGMNARNDYILLKEIARVLGVRPMAFDDFKELVAQAS